jgi:putative Mg2+ transporter-C (MgtC) family protein
MTEYEALLRIGLAALLGGVIGFDRQAQQGSAGLRTHILVALGAAAFTVVAVMSVDHSAFEDQNAVLDPTRIIEGIITGIGFLGGAIVFREGERTRNVTTAAGIWGVTGVGITAGLGYYVLATGVTVFIVAVLYLLKRAEQRFSIRKDPIRDD